MNLKFFYKLLLAVLKLEETNHLLGHLESLGKFQRLGDIYVIYTDIRYLCVYDICAIYISYWFCFSSRILTYTLIKASVPWTDWLSRTKTKESKHQGPQTNQYGGTESEMKFRELRKDRVGPRPHKIICNHRMMGERQERGLTGIKQKPAIINCLGILGNY